MSETKWSQQELVQIAKWQKTIIFILVLVLFSLFLPMIKIGLNVFIVIRFLLLITQAYALFKLAVSIKADSPILYALSCIIPWINIIVLLVASSKATKILKNSGINVGLLGAKMPPISPQEESVYPRHASDGGNAVASRNSIVTR